MNNAYIFDWSNDVVLKRVARDDAKSIWTMYENVFIKPCKANYFYLGKSGLFGAWINRHMFYDEMEDFDAVVNVFTRFNCNRKLGGYPAFYIAVCKIDFAGNKVDWFDPLAHWETVDYDYYRRVGLMEDKEQ